jgi:hypothetical protein
MAVAVLIEEGLPDAAMQCSANQLKASTIRYRNGASLPGIFTRITKK